MLLLNKKLIDNYVKRDKLLAIKFSEWAEIIQNSDWQTSNDIKATFKDADTISKNVYIFNIKSSRSLCMVYFDENEVEIAWVGNHNDYDRKFNSKKKILKFLKDRGYE